MPTSLESTQRRFFKRCHSAQIKAQIPIYSQMIYDKISSALIYTYPITHSLLNPQEWKQLTTAFFSLHPCRTPIFREMPKELWLFAQEHRYDLVLNKPYLLDLLEFEWVELELYYMIDQPLELYTQDKELLDHPLYFNPEHRLLYFSYPVFKNLKELEASQKGNYPLLCFRHGETRQIHFIHLSPFFASLISVMNTEKCSIRDALHFLNRHHDHAITACTQFFSDLLRLGAIYGFII